MNAQFNILLLADDRHPALTLVDHVRAFAAHSRHRWFVANPIHEAYVKDLDLSVFDAVVIHYSLCVIFDTYLPPALRERITAYQGLKIQFIQDEYRWVNRISERIADLGIDVLFTLVRPEDVDRAYNYPRLRGVRKVSTLPGFIPDHLASYPARPIRDRELHVAYRSRRLPYWLGELGQDKTRIAEGVVRRAPQHGLRFDIAVEESARIYGPQWFEFIASAKSVLGTEGGASIWDHDTKVEELVMDYLARHPGAPYEDVSPLLKPYEGNVTYNTVSPRLFEAAALRTAMVMFPGRYDDVVQAGTHYIALEKDFSNFDDVAEMLKDDVYLQRLVDRTYDEIVRPGRYSTRAFILQVDDIVEESIDARRAAAVAARLPASIPERAISVARRKAKLRAILRKALHVGRVFAWARYAAQRTWLLFPRGWKLLRAKHYTTREKFLVVLNGCWSVLPSSVQHGLWVVLGRALPGAMLDSMRTGRRDVARKRARLMEDRLRESQRAASAGKD